MISTKRDTVARDSLARIIYKPARVVHCFENSGHVENPETLVNFNGSCCKLSGGNLKFPPGFILDFGQELSGCLQIEVAGTQPGLSAKIRIRFGESVSEVLTQPDPDHALHEFILDLPCRCKEEIGNTGFRFARIDLLDPDNQISIKQVQAIGLEREMVELGSFECDDDEINQIWHTGVRTVKLCCQDHILDGIKRDRLVWMGDLHPQIHVIGSVFSRQNIVMDTFHYLTENHPGNTWMNGISSYSLWWIITLLDWYIYTGDLAVLEEFQAHITETTNFIAEHIDSTGREKLSGTRLLDWATCGSDEKIGEGLHELCILSMQSAQKIFTFLGNLRMRDFCHDLVSKLKSAQSGKCLTKQAISLRILSGDSSRWISLFAEGAISPWYAFYALQAGAMDGHMEECMKFLKAYWGGMIRLGATTFWEHFDLDWLAKNPSGLDEMPAKGRPDIHADFGDHCFNGTRHSLCHGWSAGPTAWLMQYVLGIHCMEPGYGKIQIKPNLGNLKWVTGTFPTSHGLIHIKHEQANGEIHTEYECDGDIEILSDSKSRLNEALSLSAK